MELGRLGEHRRDRTEHAVYFVPSLAGLLTTVLPIGRIPSASGWVFLVEGAHAMVEALGRILHRGDVDFEPVATSRRPPRT